MAAGRRPPRREPTAPQSSTPSPDETPTAPPRPFSRGILGPPRPDQIFGPPYTVRDIDLGADDEGPLGGVLIHREPDATVDGATGSPSACEDAAESPAAATAAERPPLLLLHGWSDYIHDRALLEHLAARGHDVWALELRKHGRALREGQTPTEIAHLNDYDAEIGAALSAIGPDRPPVLLAHSTGGLTATLYAHRHPGALRALALNSPWLELHLGPVSRWLLRPVLDLVGQRRGSRPVLPRGRDHYARTLHVDHGGLYDYDERLKPTGGDLFPGDTLAAVLDGQRRLASYGPLALPVLVLHSHRSRIGLRFTEDMGRADVVLDVHAMVRRARQLGPRVRLEMIDGARHDVFLSEPEVRQDALDRLDAWLEEVADDVSTIGPEGSEDTAGTETSGRRA